MKSKKKKNWLNALSYNPVTSNVLSIVRNHFLPHSLQLLYPPIIPIPLFSIYAKKLLDKLNDKKALSQLDDGSWQTRIQQLTTCWQY